jgi:hypothetical protein
VCVCVHLAIGVVCDINDKKKRDFPGSGSGSVLCASAGVVRVAVASGQEMEIKSMLHAGR